MKEAVAVASSSNRDVLYVFLAFFAAARPIVATSGRPGVKKGSQTEGRPCLGPVNAVSGRSAPTQLLEMTPSGYMTRLGPMIGPTPDAGTLRSMSRTPRLIALLVAVLASGCSAPPATTGMLVIPADRYEEAFDAALAATREGGLVPAFQDRRAGWIESQPAVAPSVLEPWGPGPDEFGRRAEQTVSLQRRRVRIEFTPAGFQPDPEASDTHLTGADLLGLEPPPDATSATGDLELRVWAFAEQAYSPGYRVGTWSRRESHVSPVIDPATGDPLPNVAWTPTTRDHGFEQMLLQSIAAAMADPAP